MYRKLKVNNGVYTLTNTKNGKKYIGYSDNLAERIKYHFTYCVPHRDDYYLHKDIRRNKIKHNQKTFKLDILYSVKDYKDMDKLREVYLDYYLNNKEEY
jgi:predicted GIY-YIG superfamily endonuclease